MPSILGANTLSGEFNVANSLRFNNDDSPQLHKTPGGAGNQDAWTLSMWIKRSSVNQSGSQSLYGVYADGNNQETLAFDSGDNVDRLYWQFYQSGGVVGQLTTTRVFRDTSAWYNIVVSYDSANGTAGNRMRMWINGVEETSFATDTNPSSGLNSQWNGTTKHQIGCINTTNYFDGYMAEVVSLDGTAVTDATNFGEFDEDSGIWKPIDVSGLTFGTNGFYLDFEDSSNLGNDKNGGTDLTEVNIAATDQCTDTCTNNFATFNGNLKYSSTMSLAEGNLKGTTGSSHEAFFQSFFSTIGVSAGKWYAEFKVTAQASHALIGISADMESDANGSNGSAYSFIYKGQGLGIYGTNGKFFHTDSNTQVSYGSALSNNDIIGVAMDVDNQEVYFSENGTFLNSGDPTSGASKTGGVVNAGGRNIFSTGSGTLFFAVADFDQSAQCVFEANFGGGSVSAISSGNADANGHGNFEYAVPSGYFALCTKNLAEHG